ncbi:MAG: molybdopterin molybdotransferase MoeA [Clostridia bacterium]|nr:molybdopterin molybdotransferase MoeA [Clostridia bacterium]
MLTVKTPDEVFALIDTAFAAPIKKEEVPLEHALGRILAAPVKSAEYVPGFERSTVDGYAIRASDSFGCSDAIPAIFLLQGQVAMGEAAKQPLQAGACAYVPTGGAGPQGADAVAMIEHAEDYHDGTVGITRPAAPGENMIYKGDDVCPGQEVFPAGHRLSAKDIGALAAMGFAKVTVSGKLRVGILSTGDELVPVESVPQGGQIRDLNTSMLAALVAQAGGEPVCCGIVRDDKATLSRVMEKAAAECDTVLISGGSSVGVKDATAEVIASHGEVLFHGIAMKPGKPTILGRMGGKPVWGLPGHPVAAFFVSHIFVRPLLGRLMGHTVKNYTLPARLTEPVSANHGRAQYSGVKLHLREGEWLAEPIRGKSGLITTLAAADGYFCIPRDREGAAAGETVRVTLFEID